MRFAFFDGEEPMNTAEAGHGNETPRNGTNKICAHQRMVDDHYNEQGTKTGHLVCRECGDVIHEAVKA